MRLRDTFLVGWVDVQMHFLQVFKKFGSLAHETTRHYSGHALKGPASYLPRNLSPELFRRRDTFFVELGCDDSQLFRKCNKISFLSCLDRETLFLVGGVMVQVGPPRSSVILSRP